MSYGLAKTPSLCLSLEGEMMIETFFLQILHKETFFEKRSDNQFILYFFQSPIIH